MPHHLSNILAQTSYRCVGQRCYQTTSTIHLCNDITDYSKTVFVPRSKFPHRHQPKVELSIQEDTKFSHTYLEQDPARKPYVIHDGPPFANGRIHLGHAINKILKDIAARYAMVTGHKVEFITGWDCHGLPIEMQVSKVLEERQRQSSYGGSLLLESTTSPEQFRAKARSYAKSQIDLQLASFKRMGLLTDWNKRYTTDDPSYVANQLRAFSLLYEQKLIFKDLMPVNWSTTNRTTVAEADTDYRDNHISRSAYVLYEIIDPPFSADMSGQPLYALIWTTTPWTLIENQAIAFNKQETYCVLKVWKNQEIEVKNLLISLDALHKVQSLLLRLGYLVEMKTYVPGNSLTGLKYKPLLDRVPALQQDILPKPLPLLNADFVDGAKGTGLVHISPNYGQEDFKLIRKNNISVCKGLVDFSGRYSGDAGENLVNKSIFSEGTQEIINLLEQHQALLFTENTRHTYPYETRTNQPIITRASHQIFLDTARIIPRCLKALESSSFFPENRRRQLINTLSSSPNWCISRQRLWGTPIPVLYEISDKNQEKMISHPLLVEHFCKLLYKRRFMDYWWTAENKELFPQELLDKCKLPFKSENLVRGMDIFDVWSDSGLSWHTTTNSLDDPTSQADLYLEGVDQIRGWFSASSILSVALRGCLPSKRFFLHGFALDKDGRKMSKSQGNVVDPIELYEKYGVDPVRVWVAKVAGGNCDVCVNTRDFESSINEAINKIRVTFKYLIGALADHDAVDGKLDHTKLHVFDQYYLDKLYRFGSTVDGHYKSYKYDLAASAISKFLISDFSPIFITTIKDILYCDEPNSERRKSCLTVLNLSYNILLRCLYPLTPHVVHEAGQYMRPSEPLNEWQDLGYKAAWKNDVLHNQFETLIKIRGFIAKKIGSRFDLLRDQDGVLFVNDKKLFRSLSKLTNSNPDLMSELFKTSTLILSYDDRLTKPNQGDKKKHDEKDIANENELVGLKSNIDDEIDINLISSWNRQVGEDYRIGGEISIDGASPSKFELCLRKTNKSKCPRCRRYTVMVNQENTNTCDRCRNTLQMLEMLD